MLLPIASVLGGYPTPWNLLETVVQLLLAVGAIAGAFKIIGVGVGSGRNGL